MQKLRRNLVFESSEEYFAATYDFLIRESLQLLVRGWETLRKFNFPEIMLLWLWTRHWVQLPRNLIFFATNYIRWYWNEAAINLKREPEEGSATFHEKLPISHCSQNLELLLALQTLWTCFFLSRTCFCLEHKLNSNQNVEHNFTLHLSKF